MAASEVLVNVVFYVLAIAAVAGAVAVATSRNIVRSAFALLAVLFSAAALYAVMKADFIAAAQVLIYVGGILVLIIFAVMLTHRITDVKLSNDSTPGPAAFCACLCLLFSLVVVVLFTAKWVRQPESLRVAGATEVDLLQYQKDGVTGLARGGNTFEDAVTLAARITAPNVKSVDRVEFRLEGPKAVKPVDAPVVDGVARATVEGLAEGPWTWSVVLKSADGPPTPIKPPSGKTDFVVFRGVTEPIALALAGPYLFAFEVVSVLLLAALIGAAFLARKEVKEA